MKWTSKMFVFAPLLIPVGAQAATAYRLAVIDELQATAISVLDTKRLMHVKQGGNWSTTVSCATDWAYFDTADNPHFVAILLAAGIADKVVRVYVDDSLPKVNGFCQIRYLSLMPAT